MEAGTASAITLEELGLAARNHAMPLEALRYAVTPLGLHYLLIHFDIPLADAAEWRLTLGGQVERPLDLTLAELQARPQHTLPVTFECAGNGRALLEPRGSLSQPWLSEAVGTAEWTGTPLAPLLEEAGVASDAVDVVFTGLDRGAQGGVMQDYERAVPIDEAPREEVLLAWGSTGSRYHPSTAIPFACSSPAGTA
jgi:sulfane dehydrogenase subunit SoxC